MTFLTLTSDFGQSSFSLASFKGLLYSHCESVQVVDISHETKPYDLEQASFQLKNSWKSFPEKTLHILRVGEAQVRNSRFIAFERENHFFLMPDVGLISLLFEAPPREVIIIQNEQRDISTGLFLAKIAKHILQFKTVDALGDFSTNYQEKRPRNPVISPAFIKGTALHIDRYGNVITNITRQLFERQAAGREFQIELRAATFRKLNNSFQEVPSGEKLCKFNSEGLLQLSIRDGSATELFGMSIGEKVQIDFL